MQELSLGIAMLSTVHKPEEVRALIGQSIQFSNSGSRASVSPGLCLIHKEGGAARVLLVSEVCGFLAFVTVPVFPEFPSYQLFF